MGGMVVLLLPSSCHCYSWSSLSAGGPLGTDLSPGAWRVLPWSSRGVSWDRMVSCGRDNIRLWRVRNGALRSCPLDLGEYHSLEFSDLAFEEGHVAEREPEDRTL